MDEEEVQRELKHCRIHHYKAKERFLQGMLEQKGTMTTKTARNIYNVPKSVIDGYKKRGFLEVSDKRIFRNPLSVQMTEQGQDIKVLNEEQKAACERFTGGIQPGNTADIPFVWRYRKWQNRSVHRDDQNCDC